MTVRSYTNPFQYESYTDALLTIPNMYGLAQELGLYSNEFHTADNFNQELIEKKFGLLKDTPRGVRGTVGQDQTHKIKAFAIPHFEHFDRITKADIAGKRAFGKDMEETLMEVRDRKLEAARVALAQTLETGRMHTIVTGQSFAPNGTVQYDWYSEYGKTRKEIAFDLSDNGTKTLAKCEEAVAHIQDEAKVGVTPGMPLALCSPEFFDSLVNHYSVTEAYRFRDIMNQKGDSLTARLTSARNKLYREFQWGDITFISYRGTDLDGNRFIPAGEARILPIMPEAFITHFAPSGKLSDLDKVAQEAYAWEYRDPKDYFAEMEFETNFLTMLRHPQLVVRAVMGDTV